MRVAKKISLLIFCFVLMSTIAVVYSQQCIDSGSFKPNSRYAAIRGEILLSLASQVKDNKGLYNGSISRGEDQVYAMAMCIHGSESKACSDCIEVASRQLINICTNQSEAYTWTPHVTLCYARYSNRSFSETLDMHPLYAEHSSVAIRLSPDEIGNIWDQSVNELISDALLKNTSFSNRKYYANRVISLPKSQTVYAFMQCTPNLSWYNCSQCLQASFGDYNNNDFEFRGMQEGIIAYPSCFFRWDIYPFSGAFNPKCQKISRGVIAAFAVANGVVISVLSAAVAVLVCRRRKTHFPDENPSTNSLQYDLKTIEAATCSFSKRNMLGQGGFGEVFKGVLQDGSEIAVKRLSKESVQGVQEFKNETSLVAKLQHRNLVSVLGFCMEGEEKILVYEFVPNKSLDHFLFEPTKKGQLDWAKRYKIIVETAKGILYLHHDSPLKIIHRDLKASNILLDADMKPKVADFGMARILGMDQSRADTKRVVGTYGYISPEYMMHGQFSMKSDVYSFGVLVLEIISGKRNSNFHETDDSGKNLVTHAWRQWRNGSPLELVDAEIGGNYQSNEVVRCIHIALLCVQTDPELRPNLLTIIGMLNSDSIALPVPQSPVYERLEMCLPTITSVPVSTNDSLIVPR